MSLDYLLAVLHLLLFECGRKAVHPFLTMLRQLLPSSHGIFLCLRVHYNNRRGTMRVMRVAAENRVGSTSEPAREYGLPLRGK